MTTPRFLPCLILALAMIAPVLADGESGEVSAGFFSHYMWRGQRLSKGLVIQPAATFGYRGFSANIWSNFDTDPGKFTEADLTLSYATTINPVTLEVGYIYYGVNDGLDSQEIYAAVALEVFLHPRLVSYFDVDAGKGAFLQLSADHSIPLSPKVPLNLAASIGILVEDGYVGINDNGEEFTGLYNGEISVGTVLPIHERWSLEPSLAFDFPLSDEARESLRAVSTDGETSHLWGGVTLRYQF